MSAQAPWRRGNHEKNIAIIITKIYIFTKILKIWSYTVVIFLLPTNWPYFVSLNKTIGMGLLDSLVADIGWFLGFHGPPPLWAGSITCTQNILMIEYISGILLSGQRTKKIALWLTLAAILDKNGSIDREGKKFLSKILENGRGFNRIVGVASKFSCTF